MRKIAFFLNGKQATALNCILADRQHMHTSTIRYTAEGRSGRIENCSELVPI